MPPRKSQHSLSKMGKRGKAEFLPNLKEWTGVCEVYPYDKDIIKHFDICVETFYAFLDRQRFEKEEGRKAEYLEAYKNGRAKTKQKVLNTLLNAINNSDAALIFAAKTYGGLLEAKDIKHIELKKIEVAFKKKQFLTEMAKEFNLTYEQLDEFANKFFKDSKLDDV